jgi:hypothetical protein
VRTRILILFIVSASNLLFAGSPFKEQGEMTTVKSRTRAHATAKVTVQSSEAQPYDQTSGPAIMEIHLNEKFTGDIDGESPVRALQVLRAIELPASSACSGSMENSADARAVSCFKVQKPSRTERSRRHGSSYPDREPVILPACASVWSGPALSRICNLFSCAK